MATRRVSTGHFEVGPQTEVISWFEDSPLTNFYVGEPLVIESGVPYPGTYATAEHAFQAQKGRRQEDAAWVGAADGPGGAKDRGRDVNLRTDWNDIKEDVMEAVLRVKFAPGRSEHDYLLKTGDLPLIEGTTWSDTYWGVDLFKSEQLGEWVGQNRLGVLLMRVRGDHMAEHSRPD